MSSISLVPAPILDRPLITDDMMIQQIATQHTPPGWVEEFECAKKEIEIVSSIVEQLGDYYPLPKDIFKAFDLTPLACVSVIIIGQDPYPGTDNNDKPIAHGLAFSVPPHVPLPASLQNIYKELDRSSSAWKCVFDEKRKALGLPYIKRTHPKTGSLVGWAKQGVLLINACLTTKPKSRAGHPPHIWKPFLCRIMEAISNRNPKAIYLLLGGQAQKWKSLIKPSHPIIETSHPSPLSVRYGFDGSNVFVKINELLISQGRNPINWAL